MIKAKIIDYFKDCLSDMDIEPCNIIIQKPRNHADVDYATNIALTLSKKLGQKPIDIALRIKSNLDNYNNGFFEKITIASPGFINLKINPYEYFKNINHVLKTGDRFGKSKIGKGKNCLVEFVSANPTGPLTIGHGRGAIIGEFASRILEWCGYNVEKEYYFNNAGRQMRILAESVYARYCEILKIEYNFPEDGYHGKYIYSIAEKLVQNFPGGLNFESDNEKIKDFAEKIIFIEIKKTLKNLGISFDNFFNEKNLYEKKKIEQVLIELDKKDLIYDKDGAKWFKATKLNLNQDRVLIKSTGEPTYRLPDIAYHKNKFERNYDLIVDVFGADHQDAFPDVIGACKALGFDSEKIKVLVHQFVTVLENGKPIKMSTRKANFITLNELISKVGSDVVKYFFAMRGMNSHLNFDLNLAQDESDQNPVFYIQYAHARACNILNRANYDKSTNFEYKLLGNKEEISIAIKILSFPDLIIKAKEDMEPQIISNYLFELASSFHHFYAKHKVISDDKNLTLSRLHLMSATKQVIKNGLNVLNISAPEKM